jgi:hypothetical protein
MQKIQRALRVTALPTAFALVLAACGGGVPTAAPGTQNPAGTAGATAPGATSGGALLSPEDLPSTLTAPIFGAEIPTPTCTDLSGGRTQCRWIVDDGALLLDADADPSFETEAEWRTAFGTAGFDEEIPGIGVAALGGDNPLADGWRASAYTSDGIAYTVTVNKPGDQAAVKAMVIAILTALAS